MMGKIYDDFKNEAESRGYFVNPDVEFVEFLLENIKTNMERYGYGSCPCRLSSGIKQEDLDLICPCDYRDMDLNDYGACYCALYVNKDIAEGKQELKSIPDRRFDEINKEENKSKDLSFTDLKYPIYRCKVCGYLCARDNPPEICPICKVEKDKFERLF
ncbi:ferredoxin-thioredoxin reductase catalytic domain-containing protein [uncultured Methanobrevibacter sp.]|uniref:ferredoxin-thioredoxin reductase catalytic domain-containing protein n=1 Tax=uncultured Methanobrevibacter sp. TaxID=253161 RepID=UPI0025DD3A83|nr:ferredoxin-thioredoxin reductase catalytic domain-containing protein [uncultured Methanobrevibacter sp.]